MIYVNAARVALPRSRFSVKPKGEKVSTSTRAQQFLSNNIFIFFQVILFNEGIVPIEFLRVHFSDI